MWATISVSNCWILFKQCIFSFILNKKHSQAVSWLERHNLEHGKTGYRHTPKDNTHNTSQDVQRYSMHPSLQLRGPLAFPSMGSLVLHCCLCCANAPPSNGPAYVHKVHPVIFQWIQWFTWLCGKQKALVTFRAVQSLEDAASMKETALYCPTYALTAFLPKEAQLLVVRNYTCIYRSSSINLGIPFTAHQPETSVPLWIVPCGSSSLQTRAECESGQAGGDGPNCERFVSQWAEQRGTRLRRPQGPPRPRSATPAPNGGHASPRLTWARPIRAAGR